MQVAQKCVRARRGPSRHQYGRKPDSRKNAKMPSAASADPNTSPRSASIRPVRPELELHHDARTTPMA